MGSRDSPGDLVKVYRPVVPEGFEWVFPVDDADWEVFRSFDGSSQLESWTPVGVRLGYSEAGMEYELAPMPWMGSHVLLLKREAIDALGDYLGRWGELLPLECGETELFVFNATRSLSALNEESSDVMRFGEGRIMKINHHVFDSTVIAEAEIFKLAEMPRGSVYLTGDAVEVVQQSGLTGTDFELVWSDDC